MNFFFGQTHVHLVSQTLLVCQMSDKDFNVWPLLNSRISLKILLDSRLLFLGQKLYCAVKLSSRPI